MGQSDKVIIRNNKAFYNVAGIESENSTNVEIYGNEAFENTSGLLIFNLPELTLYGGNVKAYNNNIYNNNLTNFAVKGSIVSAVPKGAGVVIMATKDVAFYNNTVADHKTVNLCVVSYDFFAADRDVGVKNLTQQPRSVGYVPFQPIINKTRLIIHIQGELPYMITNFPIVFGCPPLPTTLVICGCIKTVEKSLILPTMGFLRRGGLCKTMSTSFAYKTTGLHNLCISMPHTISKV